MKINFFVKICICAFILTAGSSRIMAKTVSLGFQVGDIVAAECTSAPIAVWAKEQFPYPCNFSSPRYVAIVLKMYPARTINPVDYTPKINNQTYNCIAIKSGIEQDTSFTCGSSTLSAPQLGNAQQHMFILLYIADGKKIPSGSSIPAVFECKLANRQPRQIRFNISNIGNKNFTPARNIPAAGLLK